MVPRQVNAKAMWHQAGHLTSEFVFSSVKYISETYLTGVLKGLGHSAGELVRPELVSGVLTVT